jgi:hypothetical protein
MVADSSPGDEACGDHKQDGDAAPAAYAPSGRCGQDLGSLAFRRLRRVRHPVFIGVERLKLVVHQAQL